MAEKPQKQEIRGPCVENLMLANHAEVVNGLLYISGGCWNNHHRPAPGSTPSPVVSHIGIACTILVPWGDTNRRHRLTISIEHADGGREPLINGDIEFEAGRPAGAPGGSDQRAAIAMNADVVFPEAGHYVLRVRLSSGDTRTFPFQVFEITPVQLGRAG